MRTNNREELLNLLWQDISNQERYEIEQQLILLDKIVAKDKKRAHYKPRLKKPTSNKSRTRI